MMKRVNQIRMKRNRYITMKLRTTVLLVWIAVIFMALPCSAAAGNLLENPSFEEGGTDPSAWSRDLWQQGESYGRTEVTTEQAHSGKRSLLIENLRENDAKWVQTVKVKSGQLYRLSGYVLVDSAGSAAKGANLSVLGVLETSAELKSTSGAWTYVELYGRTGPKQEELKVAARVGGYGSLNKGKAFFDDLSFEEVDSAPSGTKVISFDEQKPAPGPDGPQATTSGTPFEIMLYAILFFGVYAAAYITLFRKDRMAKLSARGGYAAVAAMLGLALILRLLIAPETPGHPADMVTFKAWANHAASAGLSHFYTTDMFADYPPGYIYVLYVLGLIRGGLQLGFDAKATLLLMKLPAMLADGAIALMLYRMARERIGTSAAFGVALLFAMNPAVIVNSTVWGQVDSFFTLFLLLTFSALQKGKIVRMGIWFALAVLIKPQALIFTPVLLFAYYRARSWKQFGWSALSGAAVFVAGIIPFTIHMKPLWIVDLYKTTLASYPYASLNAFNWYTLLGGNWKPLTDKLLFVSYQAWGTFFIFIAVAIAAFFFFKSRKDQPAVYWFMAIVLISTVFLFGTKMHERYWFPALALTLVVFIQLKDRRFLQVFLGLSVCHYINVAYVLAYTGAGDIQIPRTDGMMLLASAGSVLLFGYLLRIGYDGLVRGQILPVHNVIAEQKLTQELLQAGEGAVAADGLAVPAPSAPPGGRLKRLDWMLMAGLTVVYAIVALVQLGSNKAPESHWEPISSGESFYIDLGAPRHIERINSFAEIGEGKLRIEFAKEAPSDWTGAQTVDVTYTKFFTWTVTKTDVEARYVRMTVDAGGFTLNELALYEKDGQAPIPVASIHADGMTAAARGAIANLFDEPGDSFYHPTYMHGTYFDEIYHARTAYEHLHNVKPYENTHPPLGKLLIAIGIKLFGMNPFGWRIVGTLFGIAMVPLMYVFGRRLFGKPFYAFMTAFLFTFDFMHFAQTRIATIDTYGVFFIILMYYFMYRYISMNFYRDGLKRTLLPLLLSGLFFGIGAASKWIVIYGGAGLAVLFFASLYRRYREYDTARVRLASGTLLKAEEEAWLRHVVKRFVPHTWKTVAWCIPFFVIIPGILYSASFLPYMTVPGQHITLDNLIQYQKDMWDYHSKLVATHGFASPWWEWPFMIKPIWFFSGQSLLQEGQVSSIVSMGNPAVWWLGIFAVLVTIILAWRRRDRGMAVVLTAYLSQYLPWMLVTRLTFIYHYFAMVPFLVLCLVYVVRVLQEECKLRRMWSIAYMAVVAGLFAMFYPILSGAVVSKSYVRDVLRWFGNWFFYS